MVFFIVLKLHNHTYCQTKANNIWNVRKEKGLQQTDWTQIKDILDFRLHIYKF